MKYRLKDRELQRKLEVDDAIRKLSYCVGTLKDYRSIRIQMAKEKDE